MKDPLYIQVEMKLGWWCHIAEENGQIKECTCPTVDELMSAPDEALNRLLKALTEGTYHGDWKQYLEAQNGN